MKLPPFLKQVEDSIVYSGKGELIFYLPDNYFTDANATMARVEGAYLYAMGVFDWGFIDENGKASEPKVFKFPTMLRMKPNRIEKVKDFVIKKGFEPTAYRLVHFKNGDQVIVDINVPQTIDNVELFFKKAAMVNSGISSTIPYDHIQEYFDENFTLNGKGYGVNMQLLGLLVSEIYRDPTDLSKPFRLSKKIDSNMCDYKTITVKMIPKFVSPLVSITSENWDNSILAAINMSMEGNNTVTPLEKVVTG